MTLDTGSKASRQSADMLRMFGNDERYYTQAAEEMANGEVRQGLWTKALAETGYDDQRARARYLKLRVGALKTEAVAGSRFMASVAKTLRVSVVFGIACVLLAGLGVVGIAVARYYGWLEMPQVAEVRVSDSAREWMARRQADHLDSYITQLERNHPALNPQSAVYDSGLTDRVKALWAGYEQDGYLPLDALRKAVKTTKERGELAH